MRSLSVPAAALCLAVAIPAQAFTITSTCGATTQLNVASYPTSTTSTAGGSNLRVTGAAGTDQLFQSWWYYRLAGDTREFAFNNAATANFQVLAAVPKGNRRTLLWTNCDGRGFNASLTYEVYATSATAGIVSEVMTISNPTNNPITINLFHYADFDVCNVSTNNNADFSGPPRQLKITNSGTCNTAAFHLACGWDNWEVATWPALLNKLASATNTVADDLTNSGTPYGPGDESAAYQWKDRVIPPNGSVTFLAGLGVDVAVPACGEATVTRYCNAKNGTNGAPAWSPDRAFIGGALELTITNGFGGSAPVVLLGVGQICNAVPPFGTLAVNQIMNFTLPAFNATLVSSACLTLPNDATLLGFSFHTQGWFADPGAAGFPLAHTEGMERKLGSQ